MSNLTHLLFPRETKFGSSIFAALNYANLSDCVQIFKP
jgi:hypothetical protein